LAAQPSDRTLRFALRRIKSPQTLVTRTGHEEGKSVSSTRSNPEASVNGQRLRKLQPVSLKPFEHSNAKRFSHTERKASDRSNKRSNGRSNEVDSNIIYEAAKEIIEHPNGPLQAVTDAICQHRGETTSVGQSKNASVGGGREWWFASGRGSARGISPSLLQRIANVIEPRAERSYPGSRGG
jgi:hypothetical protein